MKKTPVVLIDDPQANDLYDLSGALSTWRDGLAALIQVQPESESASAGTSAQTGDDAEAITAETPGDESPTTALLRSRPAHFHMTGKGVAARTFGTAEGAAVLKGLGHSPLAIVAFVSHATFPLLFHLAQDETTRDFLKVGVTGVRMDTLYNLARKLMVDHVISYHEHSRALEKVLCSRLDLMLNAHEERLWQERQEA